MISLYCELSLKLWGEFLPQEMATCTAFGGRSFFGVSPLTGSLTLRIHTAYNPLWPLVHQGSSPLVIDASENVGTELSRAVDVVWEGASIKRLAGFVVGGAGLVLGRSQSLPKLQEADGHHGHPAGREQPQPHQAAPGAAEPRPGKPKRSWRSRWPHAT